jgi:hypothetical protein
MSDRRNFTSVDDVIKFLSSIAEGEVRLARSLSFEVEQEVSVADIVTEVLEALAGQESSEEAQTTGIPAGKYELHAVLKLVPVKDEPIISKLSGGYKN